MSHRQLLKTLSRLQQQSYIEKSIAKHVNDFSVSPFERKVTVKSFSSLAKKQPKKSTTNKIGKIEPANENSHSPHVTLVIKGITLFTLGYLTYNAIPVMGDGLVGQSLALCRSKDPFLQKSGVKRLNLIGSTDKKREKIVHSGGVDVLVKVISKSDDEDLLQETLKTLLNLSGIDAGLSSICTSGVESSISRLSSTTTDDKTVETAKELLLRIDKWRQTTYSTK